MKNKIIAFGFFLTLSCQGPWSYWPENPENYQGIWAYAYIISGRPVADVCFDKMHALDEVRMPGFAFYEDASVRITGTFNGAETSISLEPAPGKPNCFAGPEDLAAEAGKNYELEASIAWDSAGKKVRSNFSAKTYIPEKFKVMKAYDLQRKPYQSGDTVFYLPAPMDLQSNYYIPEYSDDVSAVIVSMVYGSDVFWGENTLDKIAGQFVDNDTLLHNFFGDRTRVYTAYNQEIADMNKDIDSIPIIGMNFPAIGSAKLLFYATTSDYVKYNDTYRNGDSRVEAIYNIQGGAGIFAGMLVDTFEVNLTTLPTVKTFPYYETQVVSCTESNGDTGKENYKTRRGCIEIWDMAIWHEINCEKPFKRGDEGDECQVPPQPLWHELPGEKVKEILSMEDLIDWCEHRNFPIDAYPLCGSAMARLYKDKGGKSSVLSREAKKWCAEHEGDEECEGI